MAYIQTVTPFILFVFTIVAGIIGYTIKTSLADIKSDIHEIKNDMKIASEQNTNAHKELWVENNVTRERLVRVETKLNGGTK